MKISELTGWAAEDLRFAAREQDHVNKPLADPPTSGQLHNLRLNGYVIGPEQQVYRVVTPGVLRECYQGIPCSWYCGGVVDGKCTEIPMPSCNIPDGCHQKPWNTCGTDVCPIKNVCQSKCESEEKVSTTQKCVRINMSKVATIDFDGTIVEHCFPMIGEPLPFAFEVLKEMKAAGWKLILWTCREDSDRYANRQYLTEAVNFCLKNGIEFDGINEAIREEDFRDDDFKLRKPYAHCHIDDKNFGGFPGWDVIRKVLLEKHSLTVDWTVST